MEGRVEAWKGGRGTSVGMERGMKVGKKETKSRDEGIQQEEMEGEGTKVRGGVGGGGRDAQAWKEAQIQGGKERGTKVER